LSEIVVQHADDGYSRRGNFGGSLIRNMVFNLFASWYQRLYGSRGGEFEGTGSV